MQKRPPDVFDRLFSSCLSGTKCGLASVLSDSITATTHGSRRIKRPKCGVNCKIDISLLYLSMPLWVLCSCTCIKMCPFRWADVCDADGLYSGQIWQIICICGGFVKNRSDFRERAVLSLGFCVCLMHSQQYCKLNLFYVH